MGFRPRLLAVERCSVQTASVQWVCYNNTMNDTGHISVLLDETMRVLDPQPGQTAVDATCGRGGHSLALAEAIRAGQPGGGRLIGLDLDAANLEATRQRLETAGYEFTSIHASFARLPYELNRLGIPADLVLADLGFSSTQMDDPARGFSFRAEGPLDMRMDPTALVTAADLLNSMSESELAEIIYRYGEEPLARPIARKLAQINRTRPMTTTTELAEAVVSVYGRRAGRSRLHPATRTFMALRIAVNDELGTLQGLLEHVARAADPNLRSTTGQHDWLNKPGKVAIISFHSLEDRQVKQSFAAIERAGHGTRLTKKPITPGPEESRNNPRARSARLRAVRIDGHDS